MNGSYDLLGKSDYMAPGKDDSERPGSHDAWHPGEVALQRSAGAAHSLCDHARRVLLPFLADPPREFFALLPFIVVSFVDEHGNPWGTILPGLPGFVSSPTPEVLRVGRAPVAGDPLARALCVGASIGVLGIELQTRRRYRVNGIVSASDGSGFTVTVQQAYGNCPRYIQQRDCIDFGELALNITGQTFTDLSNIEARALLRCADTMFVASYAPGPEGDPAMDVSHRGGKPGFMRVDDDNAVTIPDFAGNRYFNTLGNILCTGRAGLIVPNFETGDVLLLTGDAAVGIDAPSCAEAALVQAERLWRMIPKRGRWLRGALPVVFQLKSWSPYTLDTGDWVQP